MGLPLGTYRLTLSVRLPAGEETCYPLLNAATIKNERLVAYSTPVTNTAQQKEADIISKFGMGNTPP